MSNDLSLRSAGQKGWSAGLGNMLRKENARWWNPRSVLVQALVWLVILNGILAFLIFILPLDKTVDMGEINGQAITITPDKLAEIGINVFFGLSSIAIAIGAIILCHDSVFKERETGTAAWILSKPVSRRSFVLSKFLANGIGILGIIILLQGVIAYALCSLRQGAPASVLPFIGGLALLGLCCLFYGFLAMAAGTLTNSRAAALGIPLIVLFGGSVENMMPMLGLVLPWKLSDVMGNFAATGALPSDALPAIVATVIWIVVFIGATLGKFERVEL